MPELPEIMLYLAALEQRVVEQPLQRIRMASISLLKTFEPPIAVLEGKTVRSVRRLGKRIVFDFDDDLHVVIHLMIAGRFQWKPRDAPIPRKLGHAAFDFPTGTLLLTEAGTKKRASLHLLQGEAAVQLQHRGGVEPLEISEAEFADALRQENRTLKRALTDPRIFSGIGNAHSDEILFEAQLSPTQLSRNLDEQEIHRLYESTRASLQQWIDILIAEAGDRFPEKVTAFHPRMKVHGRYNQPCTRCGSPIQRIVFADNETNYCATCQTGGRLLADRAFSKLLKDDWPRTLEELDL
jgi:formamidopyrimidine-DNA glycosylase